MAVRLVSLQKLYTEGDDVAHVTSAQCLQNLARKDIIKDHYKVVIPLVMLGKCVSSFLLHRAVLMDTNITNTNTNVITNITITITIAIIVNTTIRTRYVADLLLCPSPTHVRTRNDESEETRKLFKGVWDEIGTNSAVQLYLKEVLEALTEAIGAPSWALKKQVLYLFHAHTI